MTNNYTKLGHHWYNKPSHVLKETWTFSLFSI